MAPRRQGRTESNREGKREKAHCSASRRLTGCPEPQSQPAVHLLRQSHSQQEVNCAQVPRLQEPQALGQVQPHIRPRTLQVVLPASL